MNTLEEVKARCIEEGECWIWQGAVASKKYPAFKPANDGETLVRRLVLRLDGRPVPPKKLAVCTCGEPLCVFPGHQAHSTYSARMKKAAKDHPVSYLRRGAKASAWMRENGPGKLTMEQVREIRASDKPRAVLAQQYKVGRSFIGRIIRNETWRETPSTPFSGLFK